MIIFQIAIITFIAVLAGHASAKDYDFGDKMLAWVRNDARNKSLELATVDHNDRTLSLGFMAIENMQVFIGRFNAAIEEINKNSRQDEESFLGREKAEAAFERKRKAAQNIERLYELTQELSDQERIFEKLTKPHSKEAFYAYGLHHIGRATLMESFRSTAESLRPTLPESYYEVTIKFDGDKTSVNSGTNGDPLSTVGSLLLNSENPYAIGVGLLLIAGPTIYEAWKKQEKQDEIDDQRVILAKAIRELGTVLPAPAEMYDHYLKSTEGSRSIVAARGNEFMDIVGKAKKAWQLTMASQVARVRLSDAMLTETRLKAILAGQPTVTHLQKYQDQAVSLRLINELQDFSQAVTKRYVNALKGCSNAATAHAVESALDSLYEGSFITHAISSDERLAAVHSTATELESRFGAVDVELRKSRPTILHRKCPAEGKLSFDNEPAIEHKSHQAMYSMNRSSLLEPANKSNKRSLAVLGTIWPVSFPSPAYAADNDTFSTCFIYSDGYVLRCGAGNNSQPYREKFNNGARNPLSDILMGSRDGGYATDARRLGNSVDDHKLNVDKRIDELKKGYEAKQLFLPTWSQASTKYSSAASQRMSELIDAQKDFQANFTKLYGEQLESAITSMREVASSPFNVEVSGALAAGLVGVTSTFPGLDKTRLSSDGPVIPSANPRGGFDQLTEVNRERAKQDIAMQTVRNRVAMNLKEKGHDPVFKSVTDVYKTERVTNQYIDFARALLDPKGPAYQKFGSNASNAGRRYLEESVFLRAYAEGNASPPPVVRQGIGEWPFTAKSARESLERFISCTKQFGDQRFLMQRTACNVFMYETMATFYNVDKAEFIIKRNGQPDYMMANEFADHVATSKNWTALGTIRNQVNIDKAVRLAVQGRPVVGVYKGKDHGHVFTILPSVAVYQEADPSKRTAWGDLYLPQVANFGLDKCKETMERCFIDGPVSKGLGLTEVKQIESITLWVREYP